MILRDKQDSFYLAVEPFEFVVFLLDQLGVLFTITRTFSHFLIHRHLATALENFVEIFLNFGPHEEP